jgi:hypothetical protein
LFTPQVLDGLVLDQAFPGVRMIGLFIARRVPEAVDFSDFDELL